MTYTYMVSFFFKFSMARLIQCNEFTNSLWTIHRQTSNYGPLCCWQYQRKESEQNRRLSNFVQEKEMRYPQLCFWKLSVKKLRYNQTTYMQTYICMWPLCLCVNSQKKIWSSKFKGNLRNRWPKEDEMFKDIPIIWCT